MFDARTTFRSAVWNHAGKILEYVLMYLTSVLIARGLGVQENGTFVGLFSISQLLLVLTSFGLEVSLNKHIPQITGAFREPNVRYIIRRALLVRAVVVLLGAAVLFGVIRFNAGLFSRQIEGYIWILLAYTGIRSLVSLLAIALTAQLQTRTTSIVNVLARALEVVIVGFMIANGMTTMKLFVVFLSTATVQLAAYMIAARPQLFGKEQSRAFLAIITFGGIYWTNTIVEFFLGRQGDVLLLTLLLPDSTQASLYDVAFAVSQLASLSMTIGLGGVTLATSARLALRSTELLERFYGFMVRLTSVLSIPLYAFLLFNAGSILFVLYSPRYLPAAGIIQGIVAFRIVGRLFGGPENAEFLLARSRVSTLVGIGLAGAFINVGLDYLLIPSFGAVGAVIGSGFGNLAVNLLGAIAVYKCSTARVQWWFWFKLSIIACAASFACGSLIPPATPGLVGLQAAFYAAMTLILLFIIKPFTQQDGEWFSRIDNRLGTVIRYFAQPSRVVLEGGSH